MVDYQLTQAEDLYLSNYQAGDVIVPQRNYNLLKKGQQYLVEGKTEDAVVLRSPAGERIETDLKFSWGAVRRMWMLLWLPARHIAIRLARCSACGTALYLRPTV